MRSHKNKKMIASPSRRSQSASGKNESKEAAPEKSGGAHSNQAGDKPGPDVNLVIPLRFDYVSTEERRNREERRVVAHSLQLHRNIDPKIAMHLSRITNYFVEEDIAFEVGDTDWSRYELADADGHKVYSAIGKFDDDKVFVFDKTDQPVGFLEQYIPQTKLGRWRLTCRAAKTSKDFAKHVSGDVGTLFVKLHLESVPSHFGVEFRHLVEETVTAALEKLSLGQSVQGEGLTSIWFEVSDIKLAAEMVERTLNASGLLKGASIIALPKTDEQMPKVFYPRHRRRVVTEWGY